MITALITFVVIAFLGFAVDCWANPDSGDEVDYGEVDYDEFHDIT